MTIEHTHHGYSLFTSEGCLVHDPYALFNNVYALWTREALISFQTDLDNTQMDWLSMRRGSIAAAHTRGESIWDVAIRAEFRGLNGSFFPTRAMARKRKRDRSLIVVRITCLLFMNGIWISDVKEIR